MTTSNDLNNDNRLHENENGLIDLFQMSDRSRNQLSSNQDCLKEAQKEKQVLNVVIMKENDTIISGIESITCNNNFIIDEMAPSEDINKSICETSEALNKLSEALNLINQSQKNFSQDEQLESIFEHSNEIHENQNEGEVEHLMQKVYDQSSENIASDHKKQNNLIKNENLHEHSTSNESENFEIVMKEAKQEYNSLSSENNKEKSISEINQVIKVALDNGDEFKLKKEINLEISPKIGKTDCENKIESNVNSNEAVKKKQQEYNNLKPVEENEKTKSIKKEDQCSKKKLDIESGDDDDDELMIEAQDDREGCRSLVCDSNGIIVAEMVYRCMVCANVADSIAEAQKHYQIKHIVDGIEPVSNKKQNLSSIHNNETSVFDSENLSSASSQPSTLKYFLPSNVSQSYQPQVLPPSQYYSSLVNHFSSEKAKPKSNRKENGKLALSSTSNASPSLIFPAVSHYGASSSRGGYVTCAVCNITKFYASVQRRYGQFTCMGCAKFFGRFLLKPRKYYCPNLGSCPLDQSPRCKACLLSACINTYNIDEKRRRIVNQNLPTKQIAPSSPLNEDSWTEEIINDQIFEKPLWMTTENNLESLVEKNLKDTTLNSSVISPKPVAVKTKSRAAGNPGKKKANGTNSGRKFSGCRACSGCLADDCGQCHYCLDKPKFGGGNTLKKKCVNKRCLLQAVKVKASDTVKKIRFSKK